MNLIKRITAEIAGKLGSRSLKNLQCFCMFIGYSRSGHSLVGAFLDAHKNACISHELNVLQLFKEKYSFNQITFLIGRNSRIHVKQGRNWEGYSYSIPHQFQGRCTELKILGDKKGGATSNMLVREPEILCSFSEFLPVKLKLIHVYRNPYDIIATRFTKNTLGLTLDQIANNFFDQVQAVMNLKASDVYNIYDLCFEELIDSPKTKLTELINFLNLPDYDGYIESCSEIVFREARKTRNSISWPKKMLKDIAIKIEEIPFLSRYTFDT